MKKLAIALLCFILCLSLYACGENGNLNLPSAPESPNNPEFPSMPDAPIKEKNMLQIIVGSNVFVATLYENETAEQFVKMLPMTVNMGELNGNEKYYYLPQNLPTNSQNVYKINTGDLMLYGNNCLVLFYESLSTNYSYTKLGEVKNVVGLANALGRGTATISFSIKT